MVQTAFPAQNGETDWWMPGPWLLELSDTFVGDLLTCRINNNFSLLSLKMLKANNKHTWQQQHNWKNRNTRTQKIYEINAKITWLLGSRKQHYLISKRQHHIDYINKKLASASFFLYLGRLHLDIIQPRTKEDHFCADCIFMGTVAVPLFYHPNGIHSFPSTSMIYGIKWGSPETWSLWVLRHSFQIYVYYVWAYSSDAWQHAFVGMWRHAILSVFGQSQ